MPTIQKVRGHVHDAKIPLRLRKSEPYFIGYIVSEHNETLFFESRDVRCRRPLHVHEIKNQLVTFDVVQQDTHSMRKAVNIDLLSGAAE
jgi:hypothetical protein